MGDFAEHGGIQGPLDEGWRTMVTQEELSWLSDVAGAPFIVFKGRCGRVAKRLKEECGLTHTQALNAVAKTLGWESWAILSKNKKGHNV